MGPLGAERGTVLNLPEHVRAWRSDLNQEFLEKGAHAMDAFDDPKFKVWLIEWLAFSRTKPLVSNGNFSMLIFHFEFQSSKHWGLHPNFRLEFRNFRFVNMPMRR